MKNLTWQNPEQLFVAQELINKVKSKCCGIKEELREKYECENFQCVFLAPSIFVDSENQIDWVKDKKQLVIRPYKIVDFINYLDTAASLYQIV